MEWRQKMFSLHFFVQMEIRQHIFIRDYHQNPHPNLVDSHEKIKK